MHQLENCGLFLPVLSDSLSPQIYPLVLTVRVITFFSLVVPVERLRGVVPSLVSLATNKSPRLDSTYEYHTNFIVNPSL